jgi:uncharacterized phage infection (PIP) family protein YhgE
MKLLENENTMTTDKTPELERIAKNFSESFVDTVTAQIGANAHDPKLFVQTLMRKMILQALREATAPLVEENETLREANHNANELIGSQAQENDKIVNQLRIENERVKKEHDEDLTLICVTQEGRTQWNAREVWKTNQKLNDELDQLRTSLSKSESQNVELREALSEAKEALIDLTDTIETFAKFNKMHNDSQIHNACYKAELLLCIDSKINKALGSMEYV